MAFSTSQHPYKDRRSAGVELASRLGKLKGRRDVVVLALPRGGVPVGYEVARALDAPLDVFLVRKLGVPAHRELAMGAIASGGVRVLNADVISWYRVPEAVIDAVAREEQAELERREREYRVGHPAAELEGRIVVLIDDGLATGSTMKAAVEAVRARAPARIVVAVPVGAPTPAANSRVWPTRLSVPTRLTTSPPSASGISISRKLLKVKSATCSGRPRQARPVTPDAT